VEKRSVDIGDQQHNSVDDGRGHDPMVCTSRSGWRGRCKPLAAFTADGRAAVHSCTLSFAVSDFYVLFGVV
jgi:hypothetical protein